MTLRSQAGLAAQRTDVALDQGDGRLQLVADNRDKRALELIRLPEAGDITDGGDHMDQAAIDAQQRSVGNTYRQGRSCEALQVSFDLKGGVRCERPAPGLRLSRVTPSLCCTKRMTCS